MIVAMARRRSRSDMDPVLIPCIDYIRTHRTPMDGPYAQVATEDVLYSIEGLNTRMNVARTYGLDYVSSLFIYGVA